MSIDPTKQYQTRDTKQAARIVCTNAFGKFPIVVLIKQEDYESASTYAVEYFQKCFEEVPQKRRLHCWMNIYDRVLPTTHETKADADRAHCSFNGTKLDRLACVEVNGEYTLGEGLI